VIRLADQAIAEGQLQWARSILRDRASSCAARSDDRRDRIAKELALGGDTPESLFTRAADAQKRGDARGMRVAYERAIDAIEHDVGEEARWCDVQPAEDLRFVPEGGPFLAFAKGFAVDLRSARELAIPEDTLAVDPRRRWALASDTTRDPADDRPVVVVDVAGGKKLLEVTARGLPVYDDALTRIAWLAVDGVHVRDLTTGIDARAPAGEEAHDLVMVDSDRVAWRAKDGLHVRSADGRVVVLRPLGSKDAEAKAIGPADGKRLAVAWTSSVLALYDGDRIVARRDRTFGSSVDARIDGDERRARFAWTEIDESMRGRDSSRDALRVGFAAGPAMTMSVDTVEPCVACEVRWMDADHVRFSYRGWQRATDYTYDLRGKREAVPTGGWRLAGKDDVCALAKHSRVVCGPDDAFVVSAGMIARLPDGWAVVDPKTGAPRIRLADSEHAQCGQHAMPSGRFLACPGDDARSRAFDLTTGALVWTGPAPNDTDRCCVGARIVPTLACGDPSGRPRIEFFGVSPAHD
jgi:hypothetical protein